MRSPATLVDDVLELEEEGVFGLLWSPEAEVPAVEPKKIY